MTRENAVQWSPPADWTFRRNLHAAHECGWTCTHPNDDPAGFTTKWEAHAKACPWPDDPPLVETVSD